MLTLEGLARALGGELSGSPTLEIVGIASLESAGPSHLAPVTHRGFLEAARRSKAGALLVSRSVDAAWSRPHIVVENAVASLNRVIEILGLVRPARRAGIHPTALVDATAEVDETAVIGPYAVVEGGVRIGARTEVAAHVVLESGVVLGADCLVAPGAVLHEGLVAGDRVHVGAQSVLSGPGFAYTPGPNGSMRLHHVGRVVLEDDVHIGAGATIDRARFDDTRIGAHTALDNQVHVGHNASIGARTYVAAQAGLAGSARVGSDCEVGGQVGIGNGCGVGDRCRVAGGSGLTRMFGDARILMGYPALDRSETLRMVASLRKLVARGRLRLDGPG